MFIFNLSHMGIAVLLLGGQEIDSKIGACLIRLVNEFCICQRSSRGGGLVRHQHSTKDNHVEGLGPE